MLFLCDRRKVLSLVYPLFLLYRISGVVIIRDRRKHATARHCGVSLKHDRTSVTEKNDLSGTGDCKNMTGQTNSLIAKL